MKALSITKLPRSTRRLARSLSPVSPRVYHVPTRVRSLKPNGEYWTDSELLALGESSDIKYELCDGEIIAIPPAKPRHGMVISQLIYLLGCHVYEHKLGKIFEGQTGFRLSFEHCYEPDVSFVSNDRMKLILTDEGLDGLFHAAPDLAVEVRSPSDGRTTLLQKAREYLRHGSRLVWIIDPDAQDVVDLRSGEPPRTLRLGDELDGGDVVPGFRFPVSRLFE